MDTKTVSHYCSFFFELFYITLVYRFKFCRRMVLVDTNQQQLIIIREDSMIPVRSTDLGRNFQVYFPHQIRWLSSSQVMMNNTITGNEEEVIVHRVLISEYLGKMWTMNIESRNQNSILAAR